MAKDICHSFLHPQILGCEITIVNPGTEWKQLFEENIQLYCHSQIYSILSWFILEWK